MNGDSEMYKVQGSDLHGPRNSEITIEEFLRAKGLAHNGTGIDKLCRLLAYLIETGQLK